MAHKNRIRKIISSPLVHTFLIYVSGGWIVLEMTDFFINNYGLNERIRDILLIILAAGLPVAIILAWVLGREKDEKRDETETSAHQVEVSPEKKPQSIFKILKEKPWFSIPVGLIIILLIASGVRVIHRQSRINWALKEALPQMESYIHELDFIHAFETSQKTRKYLSGEPVYTELDSFMTTYFTILTDPEGADVYYKPYSDVEGEWILFGSTPIIRKAMPVWTFYRWKFQKPGYEDVYAVANTSEDTLYRTLHETGDIPDGMVYVEGIWNEPVTSLRSGKSAGFFMDRFEVTNREYKEFVDSGGYHRPEFWQHPFVLDDDTLSFEQAKEFFTDATGCPGPSTWIAGDYPGGHDDYPVSGISWYEAAAYAQFKGKELPTFWHWRSAAGHMNEIFRDNIGSSQIPLSNMGGEDPEPVGLNPGISPFGAFDMAGNVREWCWNRSPEDRAISGGAWNDVSYMATNRNYMPAFDRSARNGFRCAVYPHKEKMDSSIFQPVPLWGTHRDYNSEEPVSEMEFRIYKKQFLYDRTELNSRIENRDESPEDWVVERISFDAAYDHERMIAYLFLPENVHPPYQTVVYFPGAYAGNGTVSIFDDMFTDWNLDFIIKNGRAVMFPIYKGTYERIDGSCQNVPDESHQYTECLIKWVKDFSRSVDYLETRQDIDTTSLCYMGDSWGGYLGAIIPAVENRLKLVILIRGGLPYWKRLPEADEINYVSRIKIPVLMLNGRYDIVFPYETTVQPMFNLLATPAEDKRLVLYDMDHFVPKTEMIKEVLSWLDKYFGPVRR